MCLFTVFHFWSQLKCCCLFRKTFWCCMSQTEFISSLRVKTFSFHPSWCFQRQDQTSNICAKRFVKNDWRVTWESVCSYFTCPESCFSFAQQMGRRLSFRAGARVLNDLWECYQSYQLSWQSIRGPWKLSDITGEEVWLIICWIRLLDWILNSGVL